MPADYERQRRYERRESEKIADIGEIPAVHDPKRRETCRTSLLRFLTTYFPASTGLSPFSDDHQRIIARIENALLHGGLALNAVYRGFAKTTICENASTWATLYGYRKFIPVFGSDAGAASGILDSIKIELSENDLLYEDFPEVCHAVRALEGKPQRCLSQTYHGELTHIEWTADQIVYPTIKGSVASGAILSARGITGAARGLKHKRPDGVQQRPDFVFIDDPQTDESARTPLQVGKRLDVIRKSILKLGGHNRKIAVVMNATVIRPDDLVAQLLDPKKNPIWQGERIPMVKRWANAHEKLWLDEYATIRSTYNSDQIEDQRRAHADATEFYRQHRHEMDAGCVVSWEHCYDHETELSAIQHAYNLLIDDGPEVFASECQNEPIVATAEEDERVNSEQFAAKAIPKLKRGVVPLGMTKLVSYIDVQQKCLFWMVLAVNEGFSGHIVDYGAWPDQQRMRFTLRDAQNTFAKKLPGRGLEGQIYGALEKLTAELGSRDWRRENGDPMKIDRGLVDAKWGKSTDVVKRFCREQGKGIWYAAEGRGVGADSVPWDQIRTRQPGETFGNHWIIKQKPTGREVHIDTNFYKSFTHERLKTAVGDVGCYTMFGKSGDHLMLFDHLHAEYGVATEGRGRRVTVWKLRPEKPDNHLKDCLCGCSACASTLGCSLLRKLRTGPAPAATKKPVRKAVKYLNPL